MNRCVRHDRTLIEFFQDDLLLQKSFRTSMLILGIVLHAQMRWRWAAETMGTSMFSLWEPRVAIEKSRDESKQYTDRDTAHQDTGDAL